MSERLRQFAVVVPGFAALGIAVLYAVGAIVRTGQLEQAHLGARETLPLIPLQQVLAVGIGTLASSIMWFVTLAFIAWVYLYLHPRLGTDQPSRAINRYAALVVYVLGVCSVAWWFWLFPFFAAIVPAAAQVLAFFAIGAIGEQARVLRMLMIYAAVLIASSTAAAYFSPTPLPRVRVVTQSGSTVFGSLIAIDGGSFYVATTERHFVEVPASDVLRGIVTHQKRHAQRPVLKIVWSWI